MSENNRKDFAGAPDFDTTLGWRNEKIYDLVLSARDISELEGRTAISADDWLNASYRFDFEEKHEKAAICFTKAAELGDVLAKFYLAECYEKGKGVPQDYVKAAELYMAVSNCNDYLVSYDYRPQSCAEYALGSFYERGLLPDSTMEKAVEWYTKAAKQENASAQSNLGEMYYFGEGVVLNGHTFSYKSKSDDYYASMK